MTHEVVCLQSDTMRCICHTDTCGNKHVSIGSRHWVSERIKNLFRKKHRLRGRFSSGIKNHKFIASYSSDGCILWNCAQQTLCNMCQHLIARGVPKAVIDIFKSVDINEQNSWLKACVPCFFHRGLNVFKHEKTIRKPRQRIGECVLH